MYLKACMKPQREGHSARCLMTRFCVHGAGSGFLRKPCRDNGAGAFASLLTAPLNLLRLGGFQSIRAAMQAVMHDITALLAIAMRQPGPKTCQYSELALPIGGVGRFKPQRIQRLKASCSLRISVPSMTAGRTTWWVSTPSITTVSALAIPSRVRA